MRVVTNTSDGLQVWRKPLADANVVAIVLFFRGNSTSGPLPNPPPVRTISVEWADLGYAADTTVSIRDLWARNTNGIFTSRFIANVTQREAKIFTFTRSVAERESKSDAAAN